jgi:hypothetical protein
MIRKNTETVKQKGNVHHNRTSEGSEFPPQRFLSVMCGSGLDPGQQCCLIMVQRRCLLETHNLHPAVAGQPVKNRRKKKSEKRNV